MKIILVDAENVGLKGVEKINGTISDKVFVFSKSENIEQHCEKALYHHVSNYPLGANQADFCIVAHLMRFLTHYDQKALSKVVFELHSNDSNLISAFEYQCNSFGVRSEIIRTRDVSKVVALPVEQQKSKEDVAADLLYRALSKPQVLNETLQNELGLSRQAFTKAINSLSSSNRIVRSAETKKKWMQS
ncbi:conserved hypothetical protein [Vibrio nigripulchritudo MADA3029]|uniref:hypothetical protein n=1 Tax=Vibrio nigripulchritudo TaxID=28173 RepID=UPI0003B20D22|nr:hypothetical protein [Vibrio nigripulchritudo]CCN45996.1 conserved hypothetical protein [Vibrio nigripulchritudo MADA3020]CCN54120.1 conserved hypothetical protein [Vibrio nigripulchritudo MADA3021]CCN61190.1 conserved hypothetical protein [Vibrio nigripulchritudo MADA3029]